MTPPGPTAAYGDRYVDALGFAADRHRHQRKKSAGAGGDGVPYITHLMGVSTLIWEDGGDEDQAIAGLLHDVVEDTPTQPDELRARFGARVASMVELCTDANPADGEQKAPWRARKEAHFEHLRHVADPSGLRVVLADKVHNIEAQIADARAASRQGDDAIAAFWSLFKGGYYGTRWYLQQVRGAIGERLGESRLVDRFDERLAEFDQLHQPDAGELELRTELCSWIAGVDPAGVGAAAASGHYEMDGHELARRTRIAQRRSVDADHLRREYLAAIYGVELG